MIHFCTNYSSSQVYESDHPCSRNISTRSSDSKVCYIDWTHGLTGLVAFRQHLQNLARTKGFLELNKAQIVLGDGGGSGQPTISPQDYPFSHQVRQQFVLFSVYFLFFYIFRHNYFAFELKWQNSEESFVFIFYCLTWKMTVLCDLCWYKTYSLIISGRRTPVSKWKRHVNIHWQNAPLLAIQETEFRDAVPRSATAGRSITYKSVRNKQKEKLFKNFYIIYII